ncbi:MAG TPA: hypothetical protein VK280_10290 [Streptosporangiaceae bacterium]|nr:hypothetical protein [Streptosporangiaceae bacterium]
MNAVRLSWSESVLGGTYAPPQRIEQDHGYQGDHRDRDRRGEAENHDRELEQGRADGADHYRGGGAKQSPLKHFAPLCALSAKYDSRLGAERYEIVTGTRLRRPVRFTSREPNHNDRSQADDFRFLPVLPGLSHSWRSPPPGSSPMVNAFGHRA